MPYRKKWRDDGQRIVMDLLKDDEKLKDVFRGGGFDKPTEVQHDGDYYQVITHSTKVPIDKDAHNLLKKHGKHITGIGYTNKKGILIHISR